MNRIVIDVTQLVHWSGKLAGIPRVMYELAVRFDRDQHNDMVFAAWVKDLQAMCEIDFAATMAQRGHGIVYRKQGEVASAATQAKPVRNDVPVRRPITAKRVAKYGIRQTARLSKRLSARLEERAKAYAMNSYQQVTFEPGDVLFIPWGEWWDPNFIQKLKDWQQAGVQLAPIIHDIGPMVQPQFSGHSTDSLAAYTREIVPIAGLTFAVSQNTKKDVANWLADQGLSASKIAVFRLGEDFEFSAPAEPADPAFMASGLKGNDYILCVGTVELKKNHMLLYYAYKLARRRGINLPKLVIVGRRGWKTETFLELIAEDSEAKEDMLALHDVSDEELSWLYDHCLFSIFPSFYEGWGIPIAESVARGVPCACSNTSSMVEIAEGFVEHFSPYSTEECLAAIQKLLDRKALKAAREHAKQYKQTSWDDSYKQVKAYLEKL